VKRPVAARVTEAADGLLEWLRTQPRAAATDAPLIAARIAEEGAWVTETALADSSPCAAVPEGPEPAGRRPRDGTDPAPRTVPSPTQPLPAPPCHRGEVQCGAPLRLAHTDWLYHRLTIAGPGGEVAAFRAAATGAGIIPWHLDLDRIEEDVFHLLVSPQPPSESPNPGQGTLGIAGARTVAGQLRDAVSRRHELAVGRIGQSRACPFDLHALVPVPPEILRLGPDEPDSLAWLWEHWGTTQALRHVAEDAVAGQGGRRRPGEGEREFHLTFWSADWTPWRALARLAARWPALRFDTRPTYDAP